MLDTLFDYLSFHMKEKISQVFLEILIEELGKPENKRERERLMERIIENVHRSKLIDAFHKEIVSAIYLTIMRDKELKSQLKQLLTQAISRL